MEKRNRIRPNELRNPWAWGPFCIITTKNRTGNERSRRVLADRTRRAHTGGFHEK